MKSIKLGICFFLMFVLIGRICSASTTIVYKTTDDFEGYTSNSTDGYTLPATGSGTAGEVFTSASGKNGGTALSVNGQGMLTPTTFNNTTVPCQIGDSFVLEFDYYSETGGTIMSIEDSTNNAVGFYNLFVVPLGTNGTDVNPKRRPQAIAPSTAIDSTSWTSWSSSLKYRLGTWAHIKIESEEFVNMQDVAKTKFTLTITDENGISASASADVNFRRTSGGATVSYLQEISRIGWRGTVGSVSLIDNLKFGVLADVPEITEMNLVKYDGTNENDFANSTALIEKISFKFNTPMNETTLEDAAIIAGLNGNVTYTGSYSVNDNVYTITLDDVLNTNEQYTITVPATILSLDGIGLSEDYVQTLTTKNMDEVQVLDIRVKKAGSEITLSGIDTDDTVDVYVKLVKSGNGEKKVTLAYVEYALFELTDKKKLTAFKFKPITISGNQKGIIEDSFQTTIGNISDIVSVKVMALEYPSQQYLSQREY